MKIKDIVSGGDLKNNNRISINMSLLEKMELEKNLREDIEEHQSTIEKLKYMGTKTYSDLVEKINGAHKELEILQKKIANAKNQLEEYE